MFQTRQILALLIVLVLSACRQPERVGEVVVDDTSVPVPYQLVGGGAMARLDAPLERAVYTSAGWDSLQVRLQFTRPPSAVDLDGAMLLIAAVDAPTSGYGLRIEGVEEDAEGVRVEYVVLTPAADCITGNTPQTPFQVVRLRALEGPVRFVAREEALPCTFDW